MKTNSVWSTDQVGGFCIALAAGVILGWLWATKPSFLESVKWLDVMTAFGTFGAVVAALGIALWQNRQIQQSRHDEAILLLAEAYPRLLALAATCEATRLYFADFDTVDKDPATSLTVLETLRSETLAAALPRAVSLFPLGKEIASKMAAVNSHIEAMDFVRKPECWQIRQSRITSGRFVVQKMEIVFRCLTELSDTGRGLLRDMP